MITITNISQELRVQCSDKVIEPRTVQAIGLQKLPLHVVRRMLKVQYGSMWGLVSLRQRSAVLLCL